MSDRNNKKYVCGVDWRHGWDQALTFYPTIESIKHNAKCWEGCGIVEIEAKFNGWIEKQDIGKNAVSFQEWEKLDRKALAERIETISRQLEVAKFQLNRLKPEDD